MSYILDALRRAEAQRQQQNPPPPGLGSAPTPIPPAAAPAATPPAPAGHPAQGTAAAPAGPVVASTTARQLALGTLLVAGIGALWLLATRERPPTPATEPVASKAPAQAPAPVLAPVPAPPPAPLLAPAPPPSPPAAPSSPRQPAPPSPPSPPPPPQPSPPVANAVPRYAELPEAVRSGLPAISVQGVTWSENAALRHLIVNGRVLQEGQSIGPDHVLERIDRDGSVLRYRGQRYRIGH